MNIHAKQIKQDIVVNSIIGEGARFRGDFELDGLLRIDGSFEGTIESGGKVLVGRHGIAVVPTINARVVIVGGKVTGNINALEKVTILSTGSVDGDIATPRLLAEEGVTLNGKVTMQPDSMRGFVGAPAPGRPYETHLQQEIDRARQEIDSM